MKPCIALVALFLFAGVNLAHSAEPPKIAGRQTKVIEGWTLRISDELFEKDKAATERALELLTVQLQEIVRVVPAAAVAELRKVPLWFSPEYPGVQPRAEYHPGAGWLRDNKRDPVMVKGVEFTDIRDFERETKRMPNFTLHELAHGYHDRVLPKGFGNEAIKTAFENAKTDGLYERVEQRFGDGRSKVVRAYAMTNPMEYFAECSEAYFSTNDFFPFTREELKKHDPEMFALLKTLWSGEADEARVENAPKFIAVAQRFQTDFGVTIKLAQSDDPERAMTHDVSPLLLEHLENALQVLTWVEAELRRYPAGFLQKHGSKNLILANAYVSKTSKGTGTPYSPAFIAEKKSDSILVTVPTTIAPATEVLGRGYLHQTLFAYLVADVKSPDAPLALEHWKTLASDDSSLESESAKRLTKQSNLREGLYKTLWDPFECAELIALAKTDARLSERIEIVQSFLRTLDPQFDQAFWATVATIPESQRTVCLNDLTDPHSADQIKSDAEIQSDLGSIEKKWGLKVLWEPGSAAPPMPARVRLEYSYFTDKKLPQFKEFIRMVREDLEPYPAEIVTKLNVKNLYILDDFTFRGAGVAGQGFNWLPQVSFASGIRTFDPAKAASKDFYRRTIHHEVFHLMDARFSAEGGPIHGSNWDRLNEEGFLYKVGKASAPNQRSFFTDNAKRPGFAEPYGMNIATDDRATLYARLMSGDIEFFSRLRRDTILKAKAEKLLEFFQLIKKDLEIPSSNPFYDNLEIIKTMVYE